MHLSYTCVYLDLFHDIVTHLFRHAIPERDEEDIKKLYLELRTVKDKWKCRKCILSSKRSFK